MEKYFKYFKIPFIITLIITVICIIVRVANPTEEVNVVWDNDETDLTSSVFDYADNLSDDMEEDLEEVIAEVEQKIGCDIAVVTLDESLEGRYATSEARLWVMNYADDFADEHNMGADRAHGNSIVFVDNIHREESTGRVYSWISTSGLAMDKLTVSDCESIMDIALDDLDDYSDETDFYFAYSELVRLLPSYMLGTAMVPEVLKPSYILLAALVVAAIYIAVNWKSKAGRKTTSGTTYVASGRPNIRRQQDLFLRKSVSKVRIQSSSSSGGGSGGHISSGGFSHGGGGHSR